MKRPLFAIVGLPISLWASLAVAQPPEPPTQQPSPEAEFHASPVALAHELSISLHFEDVDVVALLRKISLEGNVEVIVQGVASGKIKQVHLDKVAPETALERVAQLAGLDWKLEDKTYIISQKAIATPSGTKDVRISLTFEDAPISSVLEMIGKQTNIQVTVSDDVTERLQLIRLKNETPESAIEKVAQAANLVWRKGGNNNYTVSKPKLG
jgi:type II secretory pathway component HofQ